MTDILAVVTIGDRYKVWRLVPGCWRLVVGGLVRRGRSRAVNGGRRRRGSERASAERTGAGGLTFRANLKEVCVPIRFGIMIEYWRYGDASAR